MTTITIERAILDRLIDAWDSTVLPKSRDGMMQERMEDLRAALAAPESGAMAEIDYTDDDALRFIQRVLESDAPGADKKAARDMVVEIRTRVLKARASKPATAPDLSAAYIGAREDLAIWKKRALEAEETARQLNRALAEEVNGPTFMGEPVLPATAPDEQLRKDAERKPMTDEEIVDAIPDSDVEKTIYEWVVFIVRAVEAHHGIGDKT